MTDAVETMAYAKSGGVPWHGSGEPVSDTMTVKQMMVAAKIDWKVSKQPIFWKPNGKEEQLKDKFLLARESDWQPMSIVGTHWKPVQNDVAVSFFQKFVKSGKMQMETMGSLWAGRYIWSLAKFKSDFALGKGSNADEVRSYLLLCSPHVLGRAMIIQVTPIRVVCWNTLQMALGANLMSKAKAGSFRMSHAVEFDDATKKRAEETLGLSVQTIAEFKQAAVLLSSKRATEKAVEDYFCEVMKFDPVQAAKDKKKEPKILDKLRLALTHAPGAELPAAKGTWWGAMNAFTRVIDHDLGRDRDAALKTAWFGQKSTLKRKALHVAIEHAKKSKAA